MELRHFRYFVALAEELHFGRAANRLHLAQPSLSKQVRQIEDELGVELIDRTNPRKLSLTAAGALFLEGGRHVLQLAERAVNDARRATGTELGRLTLAFVPSILEAPQAERILRRFSGAHRTVHIELASLRTLEQWEALRAGRVQVGFLYHLPDDARLRGDALWRHRILLAAPARHALATAPAVTLEDVARHPLIWFERSLSPLYYDVVRRAFEDRGLAIDVLQEATDEATRLRLVAGGMGVTFVIGAANPPAGVIVRAVEGLELEMQVYAAYDPLRLTRAARAFLAAVRSEAGESIPESSRKAS